MFYVLYNKTIVWHGQEIQARLDTPIRTQEERAWWNAWDGDNPLTDCPPLTFSVLPDAPPPDNYITSTGIDLFSERLAGIVSRFDIRAEWLPVQLRDQGSGNRLALSFYAFRLLETMAGIDYQKSIIERKAVVEIEKLALTEECQQADRPMFYLEGFRSFKVINAAVCAALKQAKLTGFRYIPLDQFRAGMKYYAELAQGLVQLPDEAAE